MEIRVWLASLGLEQYAEPFAANDIGAVALSTLSVANLKELGVASPWQRKRILGAIQAPRAPAPAANAKTPAVTAGTALPFSAFILALQLVATSGAWHGLFGCVARAALPDGTVVTTLDDFHLFLFKLHHGPLRVTLDEARSLPHEPAACRA